MVLHGSVFVVQVRRCRACSIVVRGRRLPWTGMRIVSGEFRSRLLETPRGMDTRPTSDRLRETVFNVLQPRMAGARFLDLYAGSGANGLEALSRGAAEAVLVEQAAPALAAIRKNVAALGVGGRVRVEGVAVRRWLGNAVRGLGVAESASGCAAESALRSVLGSALGVDLGAAFTSGRVAAFDVIFLDPPYASGEEYAATLGLLGGEAAGLLAPGGVVVAEHRRSAGSGGKGLKAAPVAFVPGERYGGLVRARVLEQGDAALSFYRFQAQE